MHILVNNNSYANFEPSRSRIPSLHFRKLVSKPLAKQGHVVGFAASSRILLLPQLRMMGFYKVAESVMFLCI